MTAAIQIRSVTKRFGPTTALSDVSFDVAQGEVHALVGENGAGKSSLIKILSGVHLADGGSISLFGQPFSPSDPTAAQGAGVVTMFQESQKVSNLSVAENIFLGVEPRNGPFLNWRKLRADASELLQRLGIPVGPDTPMGTLTSSEAKLVEMARAVSRGARVVIMDEPTANLNQKEQQILFAVLRHLNQQEGVTIIYISHHLQEVFDHCAKVTILRDGQLVRTLDVKDTDADGLVQFMIGRKMESFYPPIGPAQEEIRLNVEHVSSASSGLTDVSLRISRGEVYGVYGLADSGRTALVNALFGIAPDFTGSIRLDGVPYNPTSPASAIAAGTILVPEERKVQGLMLELDLLHNLSVANLARFGRGGFFRQEAAVTSSEDALRKLNVRPSNRFALARNLSGGNQQKIAIGKWLNREIKLAIFQEPTRGIDVGAKMEVYRLIAELSSAGVAVLLISSEVLELMGVSHRIGVMSNGAIQTEILRRDFSEHAVVSAAMPRRIQ